MGRYLTEDEANEMWNGEGCRSYSVAIKRK